MYNKLVLTITLIILMAMTAAARTVKYVELGVNRSSFRNESCTPGYGVSAGFGIDYYPWQNFGGFVGAGVLYQIKKSIVKDQTIKDMDDMSQAFWIQTVDVNVNVSFIELPVRSGYSIEFSNNIKLLLYVGYSFLVPIQDHSKWSNERIKENINGEWQSTEFNVSTAGDLTTTLSTNWLSGFSLDYKNYMVNMCFTRAITETRNFDYLNLGDEIDTIIFSIAYKF